MVETPGSRRLASGKAQRGAAYRRSWQMLGRLLSAVLWSSMAALKAGRLRTCQRSSDSGRELHMASRGRCPALPLLTELPGIGLDPGQRVEVPLIRGKALDIGFDDGNLLAEKFGFRKIRLRKPA